MLAMLPTASAQAQSTLFVDEDRVGIGVDTPGATLHLLGSGGETKLLVVEQAGVEAVRDLLELRNNGGINFVLNNAATGARWKMGHKFTQDQYVITLLGSGQTEFQLEKSGDLRITGSLTAAGSTFPDYVLEPGYDLMPLDDLATYIEQQGHLPNVPSAEETSGGKRINMTRLQTRLLEKVEELTLYTLQQHEIIEHQQQRMAELEERLRALEEGERSGQQ